MNHVLITLEQVLDVLYDYQIEQSQYLHQVNQVQDHLIFTSRMAGLKLYVFTYLVKYLVLGYVIGTV